MTNGAHADPIALGRAIRGHQLRRSMIRMLAGPVLALPLLLVDDWATGDVCIAVILGVWTLGQAAFVWRHYRRLARAHQRGGDSAPVVKDATWAVEWGLRPPAERPGARPGPLTGADQSAKAHDGVAIACSGGGIRSAAFCLGGLQRLMAAGVYDKTDRVYAVSGGGYIATALHLARRHSQVKAGDPAVFAPDSPEADWLRLRSAFLLPTGEARLRGLVSLAIGIVANLGMVVATMWLVTVTGVWFLDHLPGQRVAVLDQVTARFEVSTVLRGLVVALLVAALAWVTALLIRSKYTRRPLGTLTPAVIAAGSALALAAMLIAIPQTVVLAHNAAVSNKPTTTVAAAVRLAGLVDDEVCDTALRQSYIRQAGLAWHRTPAAARASEIPFDFGACGHRGSDNAALWGRARAGSGIVFDADRLAALPCPTPDQPAPAGPVPAFCDLDTDRTGGWAGRWAAILTIVTALATLLRSLRGRKEGTASGRFGGFLHRVVLPWSALGITLLILAIAGMRMGRSLTLHPERLDSVWTYAVPIGFFAAVRLFNDATISSLHPFYRERLADTFLVKRCRDGRVGPLDPATEAQVDPGPDAEATGPQLSILCAANLNDRDYIPEQRGCTTFRFETATVAQRQRAFIGITDSRLPSIGEGSRPVGRGGRPIPISPTAYARQADPQGLDTTLAVAMATSGAAFSPVVGRQQTTVRPYRILMTLGNARLGVWLPNPYYALVTASEPELDPPVPAISRWAVLRSRLVHKPGPYRVFKEALGQQSIRDSRIYVSDGGHFDNTGIVEALRDRPEVLVVLDASADPAGSLDALTDAMTTARMDLGLIVTPAPGESLESLRPGADGAPAKRPWVQLVAAYASAPTETVCRIYFVKNVLAASADDEIKGYRLTNPDFPITATTNQFYGEYDFEAYRQLGWLNTGDLLGSSVVGRIGRAG